MHTTQTPYRENRENDMFERELLSAKTELASVKRTLEMERQERREQEIRALNAIKGAKRKWESVEKNKVDQLNKHIEAQTIRITELCTSNNEMSSRLQRTEAELQTANAELHKLREFQVQYKESLAKMREINRQSSVGIENKLEEIAGRAHTQVSEIRAKLEFETAKNIDLETKLRCEQDTNHCRQSRLNVAYEMVQNELKDCQEQLRSIKATIPARDAEIKALKNQINESTNQLENSAHMEQLIVSLQEQAERLKLENDQLKQQLQVVKSDLNDTILNLEQNEANAEERASEDKAVLQQQLRTSNENEEQHLIHIRSLEELLSTLQQSIAKLENENANLKKTVPAEKQQGTSRLSSNRYSGMTSEEIKKSSQLQDKIKSLEQEIQTLRENLSSVQHEYKQAKLMIWKKDKEIANANIDKRIAEREARNADEKIKSLKEENKKLDERLESLTQSGDEKLKKIRSELLTTKSSLIDATKESSRNKMQADSAQKALTRANEQMEEMQTASAALRRELDSTRKQLRVCQERMNNLQIEKERLSVALSKAAEEKNSMELRIEDLKNQAGSCELNNKLLKETCKVLEEQLNDYELLTSNHETRENTLIQDKIKMQKEFEFNETKLHEARVAMIEEKTLRLVAERAIESLEAESAENEEERNAIISQKDQYKKLAQQLKKQLLEVSEKCDVLETNLYETKHMLEKAKAEVMVVKEESSQHLTKMYELKEANENLMKELQDSVDQGQEIRSRVTELEDVMDDMRRFYQEKEFKAGSTQQQQTKLIAYLQLKLEEVNKKKKTVCDKLFGLKQKENIPPLNTPLPVGYLELETQLEREKAKVKTLTEQLIILKAMKASAPLSAPGSPETKTSSHGTTSQTDSNAKDPTSQRIRHNVPHRFQVNLSMRAGKCSGCQSSVHLGKRIATCAECQAIAHVGCTGSIPSTCGVPESITKIFGTSLGSSAETLSSLGCSVQTLALDEPDFPDWKDNDNTEENKNSVLMQSWVKIPGRSNMWERKYMRLEGNFLKTYDHEPSAGMAPISNIELILPDIKICETVSVDEIPPIDESDLTLVLRVECKSETTCWPTTRTYMRVLNQRDRDAWIKAFNTLVSRSPKIEKYQTILRLEKRLLDINTIVEVENGVLLICAEEGLFSYRKSQSECLTAIRGLKKVYQLTLCQNLSIALMIAGEDRQLIFCDLRHLKNNALAAECSRPAINTKTILNSSESCHLYQIHEDMLCAATATSVILLKWQLHKDGGQFIAVREFETDEPCSCAVFVKRCLIVGCNKFFRINIDTYDVLDFPELDTGSIKDALIGVSQMRIFPIFILDVSTSSKNVELLLCYNELGIFVNEKGQRTRDIDPTWTHLPFAFTYRKPFIFIMHFTSVEIIKLTADSYKKNRKSPERMVMDLDNSRYLGPASPKGIYVSSVGKALEVLRIDGFASTSRESVTSLNASQEDESSSEFSVTSSLLETLDNQEKRVHFATLHNNP